MEYRFTPSYKQRISDDPLDSKHLILSVADSTASTTTELKFAQSTDRVITFPDTTDTLVASLDGILRAPQVVIVKESNPGIGEFTSIVSAVNSILDSSSIKPYIVKINSGIYTEPSTVNIPTYVAISGLNLTSVVVIPGGSFNAFNMATSTIITGLTINGVVGTNYAINASDIGYEGLISNVILDNCNNGVYMDSVTQASRLLIDNVFCTSTGLINKAFVMTDNNSGFPLSVKLGQVVINATCTTAIEVSGSLTTLTLSDSLINGTSTVGINVLNGGLLTVVTSVIEGNVYGIQTGDSIANNPSITIASTIFRNNTININISNRTTVGSFTGNSEYLKTIINPFSSFFIVGRDRHVIIVAKEGGDFTSVSDAIDAINPAITITINGTTTITSTGLFSAQLDGILIEATDIPPGTTATFVDINTMTLSSSATASGLRVATFVRATSTNRFIVQVNTGEFIMLASAIPSYVSLIGLSKHQSILLASVASSTLITLNEHSELKNLTISGASSGIGVLIDSTENTNISDIIFDTNQTALKLTSTTARCEAIIRSINIIGATTTGIFVDGSSPPTVDFVELTLSSIHIEVVSSGFIAFDIRGPNAQVSLSNVVIDGNLVSNSTGIVIRGGSDVGINSTVIREVATGLEVTNEGAGPRLNIVGISFIDTQTYDMNILHPDATGSIMAIAQRTKTFTDSAKSLSIVYLDPVVNGETLVGSLYLGKTNANTAEVNDLITQVPAMGKVEGGVITVNSGTTIDVSRGDGYLTEISTPGDILKKIIWDDSSLVLQPNSTNYIYFNASTDITGSNGITGIQGVLTANAARPSTRESVLLGRVRVGVTGSQGMTGSAGASIIELVDAAPLNSYHIGNAYDDFIRDVFGSMFAQGSSVVAVTGLQLTISSGKYYYAENAFNPSGHSAPTPFTTYYHSSGIFTSTPGVTAVDYLNYDDGTNLVAVGAGEYAKHSLYLVGDGANEKYLFVYGQVTYANLTDAKDGDLPTPPTYFSEGVVPIASIITLQSDSTFSFVKSERPLANSSATAISGAIFHGSLLGLLNDDHPQYLLVNGTRPMAGDLDMGTFSITNVNLIDGVDVMTHASRHLPNGADALTTAAPTTNLSATTSNSVGTANSMARSDHIHAIDTGVVSSQQPDQANAVGTSANLARADHIHNIPTGVPFSIGTTNSQGLVFSFARSDHIHQGVHTINGLYGDVGLTGIQGTSVTGSGGNFIIATIPASTVTEISSSSDVGISLNYAREDHTHRGVHSINAIFGGVGITGNQGTSVTGSGSNIIITTIPASTVTAVGSSSLVGTSLNYAREDHVHQGVSSVNGIFGNVSITGNQLMSVTGTDNNVIIDFVYDTIEIIPIFEFSNGGFATTAPPGTFVGAIMHIFTPIIFSRIAFAVATIGTNTTTPVTIAIYQRSSGRSANATVPANLLGSVTTANTLTAGTSVLSMSSSATIVPGICYVLWGRPTPGAGTAGTMRCWGSVAAVLFNSSADIPAGTAGTTFSTAITVTSTPASTFDPVAQTAVNSSNALTLRLLT